MKTILILALSYTASAQWTNKTVNNGFDPTYNIAYTKDYITHWLKLENYNKNISFYMYGFFVCDKVVDVEVSFLVDWAYQKYEILECIDSKIILNYSKHQCKKKFHFFETEI